MSQTFLNIRVDADVKKKADILFKKLGMNTTTAINVFLQQAIHDQEIPFSISEKYEVSSEIQDTTISDAKLFQMSNKLIEKNVQAYMELGK